MSENVEKRKEKAVALFKEGFNCSQAVFGAYADKYGIDFELALKVSSSFGGGIGRMRETCGAASAMFMVVGLETGSIVGPDQKKKAANYQVVREMAAEFAEQRGSMVCREILGLAKDLVEPSTPSERTDEYYKKRPCIKSIECAVELIEKRFGENQ